LRAVLLADLVDSTAFVAAFAMPYFLFAERRLHFRDATNSQQAA